MAPDFEQRFFGPSPDSSRKKACLAGLCNSGHPLQLWMGLSKVPRVRSRHSFSILAERVRYIPPTPLIIELDGALDAKCQLLPDGGAGWRLQYTVTNGQCGIWILIYISHHHYSGQGFNLRLASHSCVEHWPALVLRPFNTCYVGMGDNSSNNNA